MSNLSGVLGDIFLIACLVFLLLASHPFLGYPFSLRLIGAGGRNGGRRDGGTAKVVPTAASGLAAEPAWSMPRVALCVCAYNEAAVIERKARNMLDLRARVGQLDLLVYVDAASDGTAQLLEPFRDQITVIVSPERRGKTHGMNLLVAQTDAEVVVFTDANVMIDPTAIPVMAEYFRDPRVGCVCGHLDYVNDGENATASVGSAYWRLEEAVKRMESRFGAVMGADGSLFAVRRSLHRTIPENLIDDMYLSLSILCDGYQVVSAPDARAYEESVTSSKEEFRRKVRIACQAFNVHRRLWPRLAKLSPLVIYMYVSHKLLRWLSAASLVLAALTGEAALVAYGAPILPSLLLVPVLLCLLWLAARLGVSKAATIAEILTSLAGASLGVLDSLRGRQFQTWTPAASIRRVADTPESPKG
ncbi:MAG TPA: glycosyltransferase [Stellaceae bacterium]|nr:glycosyltransferase [Stellaceae bacterium]